MVCPGAALNPVVIFHRLGPYHTARLAAAAAVAPLTVVEVSARSHEYDWDEVATPPGVRRLTVTRDDQAIPRQRLVAAIRRTLTAAKPDVLVVNAWSGLAASVAIDWCLARGVPAAVVSESAAADAARQPAKEWVKRRLLHAFRAALVGGSRHRQYAVELGIPADRVFDGYDTVDNDHFGRGADAARASALECRVSLTLPPRYLLASCRFVDKKNIPGLLAGYAQYRAAAGPDGPHLMLLGDGPLSDRVRTEIDRLGLADVVRLPGFRQYHELPAYYGLATAFVHASTVEQWGLVVNEAMAAGLPVAVSDRCGCAPDLVVEGQTGFTFPPDRPDLLAAALIRLTTNETVTTQMGAAARRHVADWGPKRFAAGFWATVRATHSAGPAGPQVMARLLSRVFQQITTDP